MRTTTLLLYLTATALSVCFGQQANAWNPWTTRTSTPATTTLGPTTTTSATTSTPNPGDNGSDGSPYIFAFDVNRLLPSELKNFTNGGAAGVQLNLYRVYSIFGDASEEVAYLTEKVLASVDALTSGGSVADLVEAIKAQRAGVSNATLALLRDTVTSIPDVVGGFASTIAALQRNVNAQFRKMSDVVSMTLPCASQAYNKLAEITNESAENGYACVSQHWDATQSAIRYAEQFAKMEGDAGLADSLYQQMKNCTNIRDTLLVSNYTRATACLAQIALNIKTDALVFPITLARSAAEAALYATNLELDVARCTYSVFRVFEVDAINAAIRVLFDCATGVESEYDSTTTTPIQTTTQCNYENSTTIVCK